LNFVVKFTFALTSKWKLTGEHRIQKDAKRPHIDLPAVILVLPHQLWRHVGWRSAEDLKLLRIGAKGREAKVDHLDHVGFIFY